MKRQPLHKRLKTVWKSASLWFDDMFRLSSGVEPTFSEHAVRRRLLPEAILLSCAAGPSGRTFLTWRNSSGRSPPMMVNPKPWGLFLRDVFRIEPCSWDGSRVKPRAPGPGSSMGYKKKKNHKQLKIQIQMSKYLAKFFSELNIKYFLIRKTNLFKSNLTQLNTGQSSNDETY